MVLFFTCIAMHKSTYYRDTVFDTNVRTYLYEFSS